MVESLVDQMAHEEKDKVEETVVKFDKHLVELVRFILNDKNRGVPSGKRISIAQYLSDISRKQIIKDYNAVARKVKPIEED